MKRQRTVCLTDLFVSSVTAAASPMDFQYDIRGYAERHTMWNDTEVVPFELSMYQFRVFHQPLD